jgi:hypothetical protein
VQALSYLEKLSGKLDQIRFYNFVKFSLYLQMFAIVLPITIFFFRPGLGVNFRTPSDFLLFSFIIYLFLVVAQIVVGSRYLYVTADVVFKEEFRGKLSKLKTFFSILFCTSFGVFFLIVLRLLM